VVAANKQDQPNAWSQDDLRLALDIPPEIPVVPCVATDKESVKRVLVALLDEVLKARAVNKE
jgi:signal recognition particle receptor subunit beta